MSTYPYRKKYFYPTIFGMSVGPELLHTDKETNHQPHDCLLKRLFRHRTKKILKLRVTGLCEEKSPVTGEVPAQRASNAENVSI